jgi:hypothetical protein
MYIVFFLTTWNTVLPKKSQEISRRLCKAVVDYCILAGNRTYFAAISLFRNRLLSRATKIRLYKTLIRPVVTYGGETWTMTKKEEQAVLIFEKKYLEEYMVLNMKMGNGKVGRIEN